MFTGIITDIGDITACTRHQDDTYLRITTHYDTSDIAIGASIACNGICLTVTETGDNWFAVMASAETASVTTLGTWEIGTKLNLERALCVGDELGGHIVTGHVDAIATITALEQVGDSWRIQVEAPHTLKHYIARKGSITLDGISLTVNHVDDNRVDVNIIPHTWQHTTLQYRKAGDQLNLEIDLFARYLERMTHDKTSSRGGGQ